MKYILTVVAAFWLVHLIDYYPQGKQLCKQQEISKITNTYENHHWYISSYIGKKEFRKLKNKISSLNCNPGIQMQDSELINKDSYEIYYMGIYQ